MKKRNILAIALALCLVAIMACGSLAYFTDSEKVTNTFKTSFVAEDKDGDGDIDEDDINQLDKDDIFSIVVYETDNSATDGSRTYEGNTYDAILPGDKLDKDPTVENTGAYPAYVRMTVVVNEAKDWQTAIAKHLANGNLKAGDNGAYDLANIFGGFNSNWERKEDPVYDEDADTLTYVYYLNAALPAEDVADTTDVQEDASTLFTSVTIPSCFDAVDMLSLKEFKLEITADAIQSMNTGGDPDDNVLDSYYAFQNFWIVNNPTTTTP